MEEQSSPAGVILCRTNAERCAPVGADDSVRPAVCTSKIGRTNANPCHICRGRRRALPARRPFLRYAAANLPLPHGRTGSSAPTKCFTLSPMVRTILQLCTAGSMWASTPTNGLRICIGAFVFCGCAVPGGQSHPPLRVRAVPHYLRRCTGGKGDPPPALRLKLFAYVSSKIFPSTEIVTTFHGTNLPLACSAVLAACSSPPQQGTSMRTTVTLWILFVRKISVSFCA